MSLIKPNESGPQKETFCSIIIPVFNCLQQTRQCLEALFEDRSLTSFEILVVDNGSSDGVENYLNEVQDRITMLHPGENLGFARANNLAAKKACGSLLLLLNNDTLPTPGWLDHMVEALNSDEHVGIVGAKLLYPHTRLIQHAGITIDDRLCVQHIYEHFPEDHPAVNYRRDFQAVTAACMLVRASLYQQLGGLDEAFFNGYEDVDFCFKAGEAGYRIVYEPKAILLHYAGLSAGRHEREIENGRFLFNRWNGRIRGDQKKQLAADGYDIVSKGNMFFIRPSGVNILQELSIARKTLQAGRLAEAAKLYHRIYYLLPQSSEALGYLAQISERLGDWETALTYRQRLALMKSDAESVLKLAENALKRGEYAQCQRIVEGLLDILTANDNRTAEALALFGDAAFKLGDLTSAEKRYEQALSCDPGSLRALVGAGAIALTANNWPMAERQFRRATSLAPHLHRARLGLGLALDGLGDTARAAEALGQAALTAEGNTVAITRAVEVLCKAGREEDADNILSHHLQNFPDDADILIARAELALLRNDAELAELFLARAREYEPGHAKLAGMRMERSLPLMAELTAQASA